ncbi:MAG: hypothetical protein WCE64_02585 [Bacteroidales bacterium]
MRKLLISIIFLSVLNTCGYSQEKRFTIRTGAGYYTDLMAMYDGPVIWLEGGFMLKTGFSLNGRVSVASVDWTMSDGYFKGYRTLAMRQMADLTFSRPVRLKGRHYLEPGLGFKIKREYTFYPDLTIQNSGDQITIYTRYATIFYEAGLTLCLDYYYRFTNDFYFGLRTDANMIWAVGFEGLTFSPLFGFRF